MPVVDKCGCVYKYEIIPIRILNTSVDFPDYTLKWASVVYLKHCTKHKEK